jgi:hypothetical protein
MKNFEAPNNYIQFEGKNLEVDPEGFVRFGDIARYFLNQQSGMTPFLRTRLST